jgi:DNA-binding transcriptional MerR regulator/methylmalonyl-CoA mutase cobalamin-binding subunit
MYNHPETDPTPSGTPRYPVRLVALRTGLSPHVLRAWERRYRVVSPTRTDGGQRLYSDLDVERLLRLRRLTEQGHAIGRIALLPLPELLRLEDEAPADALEAASADAAEAATAALEATRHLDDLELQAVLERAAITLGVPVFLDEVVTPLLKRIGEGWSQHSVSVAQEHMASVIIRRVLGWLMRVYEVRNGAPRVVVVTPPHYAHELGALMAAASAAAQGWSVTYLGPDLPVADLVSAVGLSGARAVAISAVHQPQQGGDLLGVLRDIRARLPADVTLLVGGARALEVHAEAEAAGARVVESLAEFRGLLPRLAQEAAE